MLEDAPILLKPTNQNSERSGCTRTSSPRLAIRSGRAKLMFAGGVDDIAEALTESQRRLRIDRPHPAHWAPFFCSQGSQGAMFIHR